MSTGPRSRHYGKPRKVLGSRCFTLGPLTGQWESDFLKDHPEHLVEGNAMGFISDDYGAEYNLCHCESFIYVRCLTCADVSYLAVWSNFEVADMDFWRAPAYTAYVDYLEASGGFYYEVCTGPSSPPLDIHLTLDALAVG